MWASATQEGTCIFITSHWSVGGFDLYTDDFMIYVLYNTEFMFVNALFLLLFWQLQANIIVFCVWDAMYTKRRSSFYAMLIYSYI